MKKSKTPCKTGKTPTGKNGRCVKSKTKRCKPGKTPTGKNGRCVRFTRVPNTKKYRQNIILNSIGARQQIRKYMAELGDNNFFSKAEIDNFVAIAVTHNLSNNDITNELDKYNKGYGIFS